MDVGQKKHISENTTPVVGIALSGGFIRATAQIGVLEVLQEAGVCIDLIAGCSFGATIAAAFASGRLTELRDELVLSPRRKYWQVILDGERSRYGLSHGKNVREFFAQFVVADFNQTKIPLFIAATDLASMREVIMSQGSIADAIQAAVAIPGFFAPVKRGEQLLVDGGNFNLIPSKPLYAAGCTYGIAVDVSNNPNIFTRTVANFRSLLDRRFALCQAGQCERLTITQAIHRTFILSARQIDNLYHQAYPYSIRIAPNLQGVKRWHFNAAGYCVEQGRIAAREALPAIRKALSL